MLPPYLHNLLQSVWIFVDAKDAVLKKGSYIEMELSTLHFDASVSLKLPPLSASYVECSFPEDSTINDLVDPHSTNAPLPFGDSALFQARILSGRKLTSGDDMKETIELTFDMKHPHNFMPGDSVGIFPCNAEYEVRQILEALRLSDVANVPMKIAVKEGSKKKLPLYVPCVTTPDILLTRVLEVRGVLKKAFLRALSEHTADASEKRRLLELCSQEGSSEYERIVLKQGATLIDILSAFSSCRPPLSLLIEHLPRLMPRAYSIASSPLASQKLIKIVFNVVTCANGKPGVCSSWLKRKFEELDDIAASLKKLSVGDSVGSGSPSTVSLFFRKPSKFRVPEDLQTPLIMIGPGTGIAPFIGFLEHLKLSQNGSQDSKTTRMVYFGCRYPDRDCIYKQEIEDFEKSGLVTDYRICYSRGQLESGAPKYVQDLLYLDKNAVLRQVDENCFIFICGDALNMSKDVYAVILKIIQEVSGVSEENAQMKLKELEDEDDSWKTEYCVDEYWQSGNSCSFSDRSAPRVVQVNHHARPAIKTLEFVEALRDESYTRSLARVNKLKMKYLPETKPIIPPKVVKMEPIVPIDCFLNISLMRRGFKKCKFQGKPFARVSQPLYRRESFDVFEGLWKIKDSRLERDSRPKVPRDILEKAAKFFRVPLDEFHTRLLTRLLKQYEEERKKSTAHLLLKIGPCPIWRVSLREIMDGFEKPLQAKKVVSVREVACALTMGRFNVSNWHAPDVRHRRKGKRGWQDTLAARPGGPSKAKTWHQVKEYVIFTADPSWHIYCIK